MSGRLGKHVLIAAKDITQPHSFSEGPAAGTNNMTHEVYGALTVWQNWLDANSVAIFHCEACDGVLLGLRALAIVAERSDRHSLTAGIDALDADVVKRRSGSESARVRDDFRKRCL